MYEQPYNPFAKNIEIVKNYFKSGSVLALGVLYTISILLSIGTVIIYSTISSSLLNGMLNSGVYDELFDGSGVDPSALMQGASAGAGAGALLAMIPGLAISVLVALSFYLMYFKSRSESPLSTPKAGVMIQFVLSIISLVMVGFAAVMILLMLLMMSALGSMFSYSFSANEYGYGADQASTIITVMLIIYAVIFAIFIAFILIFAINKLRYYNSVRSSLSSVELQNKGANGYGVICIIFSVFLGLGTLVFTIILLAAGVLGVADIPSASNISGSVLPIFIIADGGLILSFITMIMEAKVALGYKKYIDNIKYGYSAPVAPSAPYAPFPVPSGYDSPQNNPYMASPEQPVYNPPVNSTYTAPSEGPTVSPEAPSDNANPYASTDSYNTGNPYSDSYTEPTPAEPAAAPVCPFCGAPADPTASFCGNCGSRLR